MAIGTLMPDPVTESTRYVLKRQSMHKECAFNIFRAPRREIKPNAMAGKEEKERENSIGIGPPAPKNSGNSSLLRQITDARRNARSKDGGEVEGQGEKRVQEKRVCSQ